MTKPRKSHHDLFAQIPQVIWEKLGAEADETGVSITKLLTEILRSRYNVPAEELPKPKRSGRKPKKR